MTRTAGRLALLFTLVGLAASLAAAYVHYHLLRDPAYTSFCDVSATVSCTAVYQSRYGTFAGVPVALFGALFFVLTTLLVGGGLRAKGPARQNIPGYLFALSTIGLAVVFYLAYASFFVLKTVCPLCMATYVGVVGLFIVTGASADVPMRSLPRRAFADLKGLRRSPLAMTLAILLVAGSASALALFPREGVQAAPAAPAPLPTEQESAFEHWFSQQPRVPVDVPREGAKVLVVKFNDYECPSCANTWRIYKSIFEKYAAEDPGQVRLVYKDYPLNSSCNDNVLGGGPHPYACDAAVAVRLAAEKGKEEAMQAWCYDNQENMSGPAIREALKEIAGVTDFDARYPAVIKQVQQDVALGTQLGVHATPTFFIDGVKVEGGLAPQYFDAAIAYDLKHAPATGPGHGPAPH
ncbi:MAG: thioredoxin domain-containing protein [Acidobacteriota bacterium]|nr:thioredoxin domain-containing protein [Acidobacteriota bacterium]